MLIDSENVGELAEALHCYFSVNHEGQWSEKYELLCQSVFSPGPLWSESRVIEENYLYPEINESNYLELFNAVNTYFEARREA